VAAGTAREAGRQQPGAVFRRRRQAGGGMAGRTQKKPEGRMKTGRWRQCGAARQ